MRRPHNSRPHIPKPYRIWGPGGRRIVKSFAHPDEAIDFLESPAASAAQACRFFENTDTGETFDPEGMPIK